MAYVTVPKDLTKVKSKVVFGLTKRQLICFGGALLVGVPLFFLIRGRVPTSAAALIMVFAMLPGCRRPAFLFDPGPRPDQRGGAHYGVRHAAGLSAGALRKTRPVP